MAEHPAEDELHVEHEMESKVSVNRLGRRGSNSTRRLILRSSDPLASGEEGDGYRDAEKCLRHRGVSRGKPRWLEEQNCKPA